MDRNIRSEDHHLASTLGKSLKVMTDTPMVLLPKPFACHLSRVHFVLKYILKVQKISARWTPHILTDEQKRVCKQRAKQLPKMFQKYNQRQFANL